MQDIKTRINIDKEKMEKFQKSANKCAIAMAASYSPYMRAIAKRCQDYERHQALDLAILKDVVRSKYTPDVAEIIIKAAIKRNKILPIINKLSGCIAYSADDLLRYILKGE